MFEIDSHFGLFLLYDRILVERGLLVSAMQRHESEICSAIELNQCRRQDTKK